MLALFAAAFFCFGLVLVLLGANQADLARDLALDLSDTGLLGSGLAAGLGFGVVAAGPLFDRYPRKPLFVGACLLAGIALLAVDASSGFSRTLLLLVLIGAGTGLYDTFINAAIAERFAERSAKPMSAIHAAATLGAMLGPLLVAWLASRGGWEASFHWAGRAHLALAAIALVLRFPAPDTAPRSRLHGDTGSLFSPALAPLAAIAFAYVGVEASATLFAVPYASGSLELPVERGQYAISAFWFGLLAGRIAVLAHRGAPGAALLLGSGLAGASVLMGGVALGVSSVEAFFALIGVAMGCVYPLVIALTGQRFPHARGAAAGLVAGAGALGGFVVPWVTGTVGDFAGIGIALGSLAAWSLVVAIAAIAPLRS